MLDYVFIILNVLGLVIFLLYYYGTHTYGYWSKRGIAYIKPKYPFLGTLYEIAFSLKSFHQKQCEIYNYFKGEKFGGIFSFKNPVLFIKDPKLIENMLIKDFTSFYNRGTGVDTKVEPLSEHIVNLEDKKWKNLRQKFVPTFSSGKLKGMHQQLIDCTDELIKYIDKEVIKSEPIEIKPILNQFSLDAVGSCIFGLKTNSLGNPQSEFTEMRKTFKPSFKNRLRIALRSQFPRLLKMLGWKGGVDKMQTFFVSLLESTMSYRESNNLVRTDFIQILMEIKKQEMKKEKSDNEIDENLTIDDNIIRSNAFVFFVAGFQTTSTALSYCLYHLSRHPDIQEEAYKHVVTVLENYNGEITYDSLKQMTFINQIIAETLRLHPPAVELRRKVSKNYIIPGTNIILPKGLSIIIPIYCLHHDPEFHPEPEEFKPERFNKDSHFIQKGTYIPFGDGPRVCIGKRFAELEMQVTLVKLLLSYKFTLNAKTRSPLVYNTSAFLLIPIGGIWLDIQRRM